MKYTPIEITISGPNRIDPTDPLVEQLEVAEKFYREKEYHHFRTSAELFKWVEENDTMLRTSVGVEITIKNIDTLKEQFQEARILNIKPGGSVILGTIYREKRNNDPKS